MEKTEKTMAELEIDQNVKFEWDSITEAGAALKPLSGPGYFCLHWLKRSGTIWMHFHAGAARSCPISSASPHPHLKQLVKAPAAIH